MQFADFGTVAILIGLGFLIKEVLGLKKSVSDKSTTARNGGSGEEESVARSASVSPPPRNGGSGEEP